MDDETAHLQASIERYTRLLKSVNDERLIRELERALQDAKNRLSEIERRE